MKSKHVCHGVHISISYPASGVKSRTSWLHGHPDRVDPGRFAKDTRDLRLSGSVV